MTRDKHDLLGIIQLVELFCCKVIILAHRCFQGVDDRVARDEEAVGHALLQEVLAVIFRGAEIEVGDGRNELAVHFLREGRILIVGAKARLHMADRHLVVKGRERTGKRRARVAVD